MSNVGLKQGDKLGPYEVVSAIGKGGMGEVWKARDPRLGRDVAIKVSAQQFTDRFEREARAIAALNHPNICTLYDVGPNYLVMELIEGPTLADRIARGPMPLEEALRIAKQIVDALEAAHEKGITHRDLKPANVKIKPDGSVKVLDFGLAKSAEASEITPDSPTMLSTAGMILGTAGYMSPEQARGKQEVDKRADIWAFGVVLYEMLTGKRLFQGEDVGHTLASVIMQEPDLSAAPPEVVPLLKRCLEKDPRKRLRDIGDAMAWLQVGQAFSLPEQAKGLLHKGWVAAVAVPTVLLAALAFIHFREKPPAAELVRFEIGPPSNGPSAPSVSPDGRKVAFWTASTSNGPRLWIRSLDSQVARPLDVAFGSGVLSIPTFWSPDSRYLVFASPGESKLKKIDVSGGPAQPLCDLDGGMLGGFWTTDNKIVFGARGGLRQVSAAGGVSVPLTTADGSWGEGHANPALLPDGRHFLYARRSPQAEKSGVYLGSLNTKPEAWSAGRLLDGVDRAVYAPSPGGTGYLLFVRRVADGASRYYGTLMAQPFDATKLELTGEAAPIAQQVTELGFSAAATGVLVFQAGFATGFPMTVPTLFDRQNKVLGMVADTGRYFDPALSPDGARLAISRADPQSDDIWLYEFASGATTRFASGGGQNRSPVWSPDGSRIVFARGGGVYQKASNLAGDEALLFQAPNNRPSALSSWSFDGRFVLLYGPSENPKKRDDVWVLPMDGDAPRTPVPVVGTDASERDPTFSPDGKGIAYASDESGRYEIYERPFDPAAPGRTTSAEVHTVSTGGGTTAHWRGKELFYVAPDGNVMAVEVATTPAFKRGAATPVFKLRSGATLGDVSADGKRFLVLVPAVGDPSSAVLPYTVWLNWTAGLKR